MEPNANFFGYTPEEQNTRRKLCLIHSARIAGVKWLEGSRRQSLYVDVPRRHGATTLLRELFDVCGNTGHIRFEVFDNYERIADTDTGCLFSVLNPSEDLRRSLEAAGAKMSRFYCTCGEHLKELPAPIVPWRVTEERKEDEGSAGRRTADITPQAGLARAGGSSAERSRPFAYRLHDDEACDAVTVGDFARLRVVSHYKTSALSGDCWRHFVIVTMTRPEDAARLLDPNSIGPRYQGSEELGCCVAHWTNTVDSAAAFLASVALDAPDEPGPVQVSATWHGAPWRQRTYPCLRAALCSLPRFVHDFDPADLSAAADKTVEAACMQPGCAVVAARFFRVRQLYAPNGYKLAKSEQRGADRVRQFCDAHARRGDSCREDCDANYSEITKRGF